MLRSIHGAANARSSTGTVATLYCPVLTANESRAVKNEVTGVFKETGSGMRLDGAQRDKIMALAHTRRSDAVLVTELSRWKRSTKIGWLH
jgi:putative DNA-invertase from lambdoid prophage Rac